MIFLFVLSKYIYIYKRYTRDLAPVSKNLTASSSSLVDRSRRDTLKTLFLRDFQDEEGAAENGNKIVAQRRSKRQSPGRQTLCQVNSQFVTPQAALNSRGKNLIVFFTHKYIIWVLFILINKVYIRMVKRVYKIG